MQTFENSLEAERVREASERIAEVPAIPRASPGPMQHDVFRVHADGKLELVMAKVKVTGRGAPGRREAVVKATIGSANEDEQYGTFVTVKHGEMSAPITREKKLEPTDVWT